MPGDSPIYCNATQDGARCQRPRRWAPDLGYAARAGGGQMTAPHSMSHAEAAQFIARTLGPVLPVCFHEDGVCACGGRYDRDSGLMVPHVDKEVGKAPVSALVRNGLDDATTNSAA